MDKNYEKENQNLAMQIDPLKTKMGKTYLKGLQFAIEIGSVSISMLQRKLEVGYHIGGKIYDWMIEKGYVRDDKSYIKTTLITQQEFDELLQKTGISLKNKREKKRTVDEDLYKASLRYAIKLKTISEDKIRDAFAICKVRARAVIEQMENDGYIKCGYKKVEILITKEKFEQIYGEKLWDLEKTIA